MARLHLGPLLCLILLNACAAPSTQDRTVRQGSGEVEKVCTEKPPGYTSKVEARLKAELPLSMTPEPQAEGLVKSYLDQQPKGTDRGEDLKDYLFYVCQMSNNGGWSADTTERLIHLFIDRWPATTSESAPATSQLIVEGVNDPFSRVPQENQPLPPKVTRFARIKVQNVGRTRITKVGVAVLKINRMEGRYQLPVKSMDTLFKHNNPLPQQVSVDLNPGEDTFFDAVIECNGTTCTKGKLGVPYVDNGDLFVILPVEEGVEKSVYELTVRASGDPAAPVIKTFLVSRSTDGILVLKEKP